MPAAQLKSLRPLRSLREYKLASSATPRLRVNRFNATQLIAAPNALMLDTSTAGREEAIAAAIQAVELLLA